MRHKFKFLKRLLYMPFGLLKALIELANIKSRDIENRIRYKNAIIDEGCCITPETKIGSCSHILKGCIINYSNIGRYTYINFNSIIQNAVIGNYCSISHNVKIGLGAHPLNLFSTSTVFYKANNALNIKLISEENEAYEDYRPITIGSDVWIGAGAVIMDGVSIGHGAVIATGAIVTKDVPPYAIVAGVPAKIIKYRFSNDIVINLLKTKWWEDDPFKILKYKTNLTNIIRSTNID